MDVEKKIGLNTCQGEEQGAPFLSCLRPLLRCVPTSRPLHPDGRRSWVLGRWQGEAKGKPRREQPIRRATAEPPPEPRINDRVKPTGLPEDTEEAGVAGGVPVDAFAIDLAYQPHRGSDGQFRNHAPDPEGARRLAVKPTPEVEMEGERGHPEAHNADAFKAELALARHGRGQEQPRLYGHTHA